MCIILICYIIVIEKTYQINVEIISNFISFFKNLLVLSTAIY